MIIIRWLDDILLIGNIVWEQVLQLPLDDIIDSRLYYNCYCITIIISVEMCIYIYTYMISYTPAAIVVIAMVNMLLYRLI